MKKIVISALFLFIIGGFTLIGQQAFAAIVDNCQPIFGGGQTCMQSTALSIDKKIQNPESQAYVDTVGTGDAKFSPEQTVIFQLIVKNTSGNSLEKITVKDTLPQFVSYISSTTGTFDQNTKTLTIIIPTLAKDESKTYTITGKVATNQDLPDQPTTCVVNRGVATNGTQTSQDNAGLCIQKEVLGNTGAFNAASPTTPTSPTSLTVPSGTTKGGLKIQPTTPATQQPSTGPELLGLIALIPAGFAGKWLRKKSTN